MNIVFYSMLCSAPWGGSENLWFKTALAALENEHRVLVIVQKATSKHHNVTTLKAKGAEIFIAENYLSNYLERLINKIKPNYAEKKFICKLERKINSFAPNQILINQAGCFDIQFDCIVKSFLSKTDLPFSISSHSYLPENILSAIEQKELSKVFEKAKACYFVSKAQSEIILKQLNANPKQTEFIHNPVNETANYLPYPSDLKVPTFALVGSLDVKWKGQDLLLEILSEEPWREREWRLNLYGLGPDIILLENFIKKNTLAQKVLLNGFEHNQQVIWKNNQILLMPSKIDAAPSVLLEAMTCGRTAVCSNIGFVPDWIFDNQNGFVSKSSSKKDFAQALENAWIGQQNWERMGLKCKIQIERGRSLNPETAFLNKLIKD